MFDVLSRLESAKEICRSASIEAVRYFHSVDGLKIDQKGAQDWVSEADINVERVIREKLQGQWPDDGIIGEEHAATSGTSGFDWVIDPIDGTTNFIHGIPSWTIVLAGVAKGQTQIGVIYDPLIDEMFVAIRGGGATLNDAKIEAANETPLNKGTIAVGYSNRVEAKNVLPVIEALIQRNAMFHRNASGALSLAYVAAGRLLGYVEEHMNAWDCLAGQLLVQEAGGMIEDQDANQMIATGGRVVVAGRTVFDEVQAIANSAWSTH